MQQLQELTPPDVFVTFKKGQTRLWPSKTSIDLDRLLAANYLN